MTFLSLPSTHRTSRIMSLNLQQIRKNYDSFDDSQIERIARYEASDLEPEVVAILKEEIHKRGLDPNLCKGIEAQIQPLTSPQLVKLKQTISAVPCPQCGNSNSPLVGVLIREVKSFLLFTSYKRAPVIMCPDCAERRKSKAIALTLMAGWWGLPWGVFYTLGALFGSFSDAKHRKQLSDDILRGFVIQEIGQINSHLGKDRALSDLIRRYNQST